MGKVLYNTSWHSTIKTTPFVAVYGRDPPSILTYIPRTAKVESAERVLVARDQVLKELKDNIKLAQGRMKKLYDNKHKEDEFDEGEWVFLKLQPYRQISVYMRKNAKLSARYSGPFKIIQKVNPMAYKLDLPQESRIHPVFHISLLKRKLGGDKIVLSQLPTMNEEARMTPKPHHLLGTWQRNKRTELLIQWEGLQATHATWEDEEALKAQFPCFSLEDKGNVSMGE
jgi:hypothetical protein